jgi:D-alanyl-lipoteichoic acid acyltransferase DltB (MBOAT superfamily)
LGIELSLNFHHPWLAKSPQEFWQRWHITLSTWLRDYVYIPLGGNGRSRHRTALNVVITFMLGGLWHGAAWNFILWGLFHAGLILIWQSVSKFNIRSINGISTVLTFFMIGGGWVLFREQDLTFILENVFASNRDIHLATTVAATSALYSIPIWLHSVAEHSKLPDYWTRNYLSRTLGFTALTLVSLMGIMLLRAESSADFIYFRF